MTWFTANNANAKHTEYLRDKLGNFIGFITRFGEEGIVSTFAWSEKAKIGEYKTDNEAKKAVEKKVRKR